jgi:hypothetical protein
LSTLGRCGLVACVACAHAPETAPDQSPEAYIEGRLISNDKGEINKRTSDGGMLFHAEFSASDGASLKVPFDVLKSHCESKGGRWVPMGPPNSSSRSVAASQAPNDVLAVLAEADARAIFGKFRCEGSGPTWVGVIEPNNFLPGAGQGFWRLQLFLRATIGGDPWQGQGAPPLPPSAAAGLVPATAPPSAAPEGSPLNQRTLRPPASGDALLADPRPFGIDMGSDSPDVFSAKLRVDLAPTACAPAVDPAPAAAAKAGATPASSSFSQLCWQLPGAGEALELRARFADLGQGPVVASFEVHYPAESFSWLEHSMRNDWGPPDAHGDRNTWHAWSWLHTVVELAHADDDATHQTIVRVQHRPTLARAQLPVGSPGRQPPSPVRVATPWQLALGYEPAQQAQAKLQAVGFSIAANSCVDAGQRSLPVLTRVCTLNGGKMDGLRSANVIAVDIGDGRPRVAKLEYTFDKRVLDDTLTELRIQYGNPIPVAGDALQWWTGPIGIEVAPTQDSFTLRYFHGRLLQIHINAVERNQVGDKAQQHQGL